jgi:1-acyl-sn-glycerol-3-phosphate acyltransferase
MGRLRAAGVLAGFMGLTLPLMPVQAVLLRTSRNAARRFPHWYHRRVCRILGVRLNVEGAVTPGVPTLIVSNHTSWLDIPVLSAVAPVSFVAKKEVGSWPFVSALARLQRTVFVDRTRRTAVGETTGEMARRLAEGDALVLFAEGTSTDGNRVLPFRSSLFAAAKPGGAAGGPADAGTRPVVVQSVSIVYQRLHGVPLGRADRPLVGWYGDMAMQSHAWELLQAGPLDVVVRIGPPVPLDDFADRKELADRTETAVREGVVRTLRGRPAGEPVALAKLPRPTVRMPPPQASSEKWR